MSLSSKIQDLAVRIASQFKTVVSSIETVTATANSTKTKFDADVFIGKIEMFYGTLDSSKKHPLVGGVAKTNWQVCYGTNGTPDLRDRFVIGASSTRTLGSKNSTSSTTVDKESFDYSMSTTSLGSTTLTIQTDEPPYVALYYVMKIT